MRAGHLAPSVGWEPRRKLRCRGTSSSARFRRPGALPSEPRDRPSVWPSSSGTPTRASLGCTRTYATTSVRPSAFTTRRTRRRSGRPPHATTSRSTESPRSASSHRTPTGEAKRREARGGEMKSRICQVVAIAVVALTVAASAGTTRNAAAAALPGNTVAQWNQIAENTVVGSGAFQSEGLIYMAYASTAVYNAVVAIEGGYEPLNSTITAPAGASVDCAVVEAAYNTLSYYFSSFPGLVATLDADYAEALSPSNLDGCTADGGAGTGVGLAAANEVIYNRTTGPDPDGRRTPIGVSTLFPTLPAGPGVWRLTPPFAAPQVPWVGNVRRFVLQSVDQFLPNPPPSLQSEEWVEAFNQIKAYGAATSSVRSDEQTAIARFWSANVIRQYNRAGRDIATARGLGLLETARLLAMINLVGADALMSALYAKYHYLFWRPVTAIDPRASSGTWHT